MSDATNLTPYMRMLLAMYEFEEMEREGRLPEQEPELPSACAKCGNTEDLVGQEIPEIYDGVSYWHCLCGAVTDRWTGELIRGCSHDEFGL